MKVIQASKGRRAWTKESTVRCSSAKARRTRSRSRSTSASRAAKPESGTCATSAESSNRWTPSRSCPPVAPSTAALDESYKRIPEAKAKPHEQPDLGLRLATETGTSLPVMRLIAFLLCAAATIATTAAGTCTGSSDCKTCKQCVYCKSGKGSCNVRREQEDREYEGRQKARAKGKA